MTNCKKEKMQINWENEQKNEEENAKFLEGKNNPENSIKGEGMREREEKKCRRNLWLSRN